MLHRHAVDEETPAKKIMIQDSASTDYNTMQTAASPNGQEPDALVNGKPTGQDSHTRSLAKGVSWRVVATTTTVIISYLVTGEVGTALRIGFFESILKIFIYYVHERIWAKVRL